MFVRNLGLFKGFPYYPDLLIVCWCFSLFKGLSLYLGVLGVTGQRKLSFFLGGGGGVHMGQFLKNLGRGAKNKY